MSVELIIDANQQEVVVAILENKQLVEIHRENNANNFSVGDIFLGKVKKVVPGLNACFVQVGHEKDAFLHYLDLGAQFLSTDKFLKQVHSGSFKGKLLENFTLEPETEKTGSIAEVLKSGKNVLVQITKEPISTKGPRLSSEISIAGRYLVLIPFYDKISVSQKIKTEAEKDRLKGLLKDLQPKGFGIIARTVAEGIGTDELVADLNQLIEKWKTLKSNIKNTHPPKKILGEINRVAALLRDLLSEAFSAVHINDEKLYLEIKEYLKSINSEKEKILKLYKGKLPIFEQFDIEKKIKSSFGKFVNLKSGGYLVIEHTEALHVIDVNSGLRGKSEENQEQTALAVNMQAAEEIARQVRLRDIGGIIVIDFIDMREEEHRQILFEQIKKMMSTDRAKHTILPPSRFGLIEITRQRVRPQMNIVTVEKCPSCGGTGLTQQASIIVIDEICKAIHFTLTKSREKKVTLLVHPFIAAFLKRKKATYQLTWLIKYKKWIKIQEINSFGVLEYKLLNNFEEEIALNN